MAGIPFHVHVEHGSKDVGTLMSRKSDVSDLALLACFQERLNGSAGFKDPFRVIVVIHFVQLPEVNMVHLKPLKTFLKLYACSVCVAGADLCHEKNIVASSLKGPTIPSLGCPVSVIPCGVQEGDARIDCGLNYDVGFGVGD